MIESIEGIDIMTPGAVAAASLLQAVASGEVDKDDCILLNISGGGIERLKSRCGNPPRETLVACSKSDGRGRHPSKNSLENEPQGFGRRFKEGAKPREV